MTQRDLAVDRTSEVPLGTQLIWKLRTLIGSGKLGPGDRIPGIREIAESAGVNVNTVRAVFARLEEQGLLVTEQGRGTFVAPGVRAGTVLAEMASAAIAEARSAGIDPRELAAALYVATPETHGGLPVPPTAERRPSTHEREERRTIRKQIVELEREVAVLDPMGSLQTAASDPAPRMLSASELLEIRDRLAARVESLRSERDGWRAENERLDREAEEAERAETRRKSRWREVGVWTGTPGTRVSWTAP